MNPVQAPNDQEISDVVDSMASLVAIQYHIVRISKSVADVVSSSKDKDLSAKKIEEDEEKVKLAVRIDEEKEIRRGRFIPSVKQSYEQELRVKDPQSKLVLDQILDTEMPVDALLAKAHIQIKQSDTYVPLAVEEALSVKDKERGFVARLPNSKEELFRKIKICLKA